MSVATLLRTNGIVFYTYFLTNQNSLEIVKEGLIEILKKI